MWGKRRRPPIGAAGWPGGSGPCHAAASGLAPTHARSTQPLHLHVGVGPLAAEAVGPNLHDARMERHEEGIKQRAAVDADLGLGAGAGAGVGLGVRLAPALDASVAVIRFIHPQRAGRGPCPSAALTRMAAFARAPLSPAPTQVKPTMTSALAATAASTSRSRPNSWRRHAVPRQLAMLLGCLNFVHQDHTFFRGQRPRQACMQAGRQGQREQRRAAAAPACFGLTSPLPRAVGSCTYAPLGVPAPETPAPALRTSRAAPGPPTALDALAPRPTWSWFTSALNLLLGGRVLMTTLGRRAGGRERRNQAAQRGEQLGAEGRGPRAGVLRLRAAALGAPRQIEVGRDRQQGQGPRGLTLSLLLSARTGSGAGSCER
jgi:hypothetical protein